MVMAGCAVLVGWRVGVVGNVGAPQHVVCEITIILLLRN